MKKITFLIGIFILVFTSNLSFGQTVIWTEDFGTPTNGTLANNYNNGNGNWTVTSTGFNGADANVWYVSGAECGNSAGSCGTACASGDASLHVGASTTLGGDVGAAYVAGGLGFFFVETHKRVESPTIDLTGQNNITLNFNYFEDIVGNSSGIQDLADDEASLWYFDGTTWSLLDPLAITGDGGCQPQGLWTAFSIALPASANNNANVKIGFVWNNDDDNVGTDPTFAVDDITLTVLSSTSVTADFTLAPASPICEGTTITFTDASTASGTTINSWAWTFNGGTPGTANTQGPHNITFNTAGTYNIDLTVGDGTLTDTKTVSITVNAAANAGADNTANVCNNGGSTTLDLNTLLSGADAGGTWTETSGTPSGQFTAATGMFDGNGLTTGNIYTFDYTVTGTTPCPNDAATITITIIDCSAGNITADFTADNTTICQGETITFTDISSTTSSTAINSWNWTFNSGTPGTANTQGPHTITYNTAGTFDVTLVASDGTLNDTKTIQVTVNPLPTVTATASPSTTLCTGDMLTLTGGGATSYTWDNGVTDGTAFPTVAGSTTYTVTGTDANGCSNQATVTVTVADCAPLIAGFSFQDDICVGDCITFTDTSSGNPVDWQWDFGSNATPQTASGQDPGTICFNTVGVHQIQLTITDAGGNSVSATNNLTVHDVPTVTAELDTIIDLGGQVDLIATSPNFGNYQWSPSTYYIDCDTCATTYATPALDVNYIVTFTDPNGCTAEDTVYVKVNFIEGIGVPQAFSPNGDGMNDLLVVKGLGIEKMVFKIYNRYGELVFESHEQTFGWDGTYKGKDENPGVFTWTLEYQLLVGPPKLISGNTTLIR